MKPTTRIDTSLYSIKDLEVLSGIKAHTIRIWEKRYNLLSPRRSETNIRGYGDHDLRKLLNVAMLVKHGYKISKVSVLDSDQIKSEIISIQESSKNESHYVETLMIHMINFDDEAFNTLVNQVIEEIGIEKTISNVIFPFFMKVGLYWQVGSIFPAQEHYVSYLVRQKLIAETEKYYGKHIRKESVLFYLMPNEQHELSLLFYSLMALKRGYKIIYLGQNVPFADLEKVASKLEVDYVFSVFTNSVEKEELQDHLLDVSKIFPAKKVFISGRQVNEHNPLLPRNFKVISNHKDFSKYFGKEFF